MVAKSFRPDRGSAVSTYLGGSGCGQATELRWDAAAKEYCDRGYAKCPFFQPRWASRQRVVQGFGCFRCKVQLRRHANLFNSDWRPSQRRRQAIAVDSGGNAYIKVQPSTSRFPETPGGRSPNTNNVNGDVFDRKVNPTGSRDICTFLGGSAC